MQQIIEEAVGLNITNQCTDCQSLGETCPDCDEARTAKDAVIAHEIVDSRNLIYSKPWHNLTLTESDWVESETIRATAKAQPRFAVREVPYTSKDGQERIFEETYIAEWIQPMEEFQVRHEYAPPVTNLTDRLASSQFLGKHIVPLISDTDLLYRTALTKYEMVCQTCHYTHHKAGICPNCN